jgi:5-methylthioadenosine/S-adenosylhomocysteine deaminase
MPEQADILIVHGHVFSMRGSGVGYVADGAVAVKDTAIAAVGPTDELTARFQANEVLDANDCAVLPGLIDAHMHTPLAIVRGVAQDVAHWMQRALAPYSRHISPEAALAGSCLNVLEALKAGTTTHVDYTRPVPGWADFFAQVGVRARLTRPLSVGR